MFSRKSLRLLPIVLATLLFTAVTMAAVPEVGLKSASAFARVPADALSDAATLGLAPKVALDYGSFHWLELNQADFAKLSASGVPFVLAADAGQVQITQYRFDPIVDGEPAVAAEMQAAGDGPGFHLVQFAGPISDEWLADLQAAGLPALQYYPHNAYLTWGTPEQVATAGASEFVRWHGGVHPAYKINRDLEGRSGPINNVDIFFYNDGNIDATLKSLAQLGVNVIQHYPAQPDKAFYDAIVTMDAALVDDVAQLDTVLWLGYSSPEPQLDDEMSDQIIAGNYTAGVPFIGYNDYLNDLGYDGTGVIWAIVDTGVDYQHPDLGPHIVGGYSFPTACNPPGEPGSDCSVVGGHGTHVAGIVGGDASGGFADPSGFLYGLGVAPGYGIFAMNSLSGTPWPPTGGWQEHSKQAVLGGAVGGNNSWTTGELPTPHGYQSSERTHDIMVRDGNFDTTTVAEPFIEVFSAGNSGFVGLTAPKEGKNLIITASSRNYRIGSIDTISSFSSRGPAVDGRNVPTIATPGEQIASSRADTGGACAAPIAGTNNLYAYCSGTSMAAPHTSGAIVLITEWWRTFNGGADPSPAMAKALLVNGSTDMGTADRWNINEGWGRVYLPDTIAPEGVSVIYRDQLDTFGDTGDQYVLGVLVPDPSQPLKITIAWSDAPGAVGANPALVNNLDLTVVNASSTYLGNVFSAGWSATGGSPDALNNLENVFVQNPADNATITIDATNIAGDGVPYNADTTDQDFVLICSNCALNADFTLTATPGSQDVCAPADADYTVDVGSILGYSDPVTLSATGHPAGTTVSFDTNPVTPPDSVAMTVGNTGAAAPGTYAIDVVGVATTSTHTTTVGLNLYTTPPGTPTLTSPANGATNVAPQPTFTWAAASQGGTYEIEIATDSGFTNIVDSASGLTNTSYTPAAPLATNTTHYWRVRSENTCGTGSDSATFSFVTEPAPGDCSAGATPNELYTIDFESGSTGWSSSGTGNTWALSTQRSHSAATSYKAINSGVVTDQRLMSPAVALPTGEGPLTLQFWNYQAIESNPPGCYDGAILEISTNGGSSWTQLDAELLTDPYDGPVDSNFSNPLAGLDAWCGDPQDWTESIVDLDGYAGEAVNFRFRLGTDSTISREGWYVDDVTVQSCQTSGYNAVLLDDTSEIDTLPGTTATHEFVLQNLGQGDTYGLSVSGNEWTTTIVSANPVSVPGSTTTTIQVEVGVPELETLHDTDVFTLTVTSQGDPGLVLTAVGTTNSVTNPAVSTSGDANQVGVFGQMATYEVLVSNNGDYEDTYIISLAPSDWTVDAPTSVTVAAGTTASVFINVTVGVGLSDSVDVTFTSSLDPSISETITLTTSTYLLHLPYISRY